jgi:hypothetical protein
LTVVFILSFSPVFSQTPVNFYDFVQEYADAIGGNLPVAASAGNDWSTPYIGQLIGYPLHFGVGVFVSSMFFSNTPIVNLADKIGITTDGTVMKGRQWLPAYTISARIGGLGNIPFDLGVKAGYLPDIALWGSLDYHTDLFGVDLHYNLFASETGTIIAIGAGYDNIKGGVKGVTTIAPSDMPALTPDMPVEMTWSSSVFRVKFLFSQSIWSTGIRFFGNFLAGYASTEAGIKFANANNVMVYEDTRDVSGLTLSGILGFGIELNQWYIDVSFMPNFLNFELGVSVGFRYQR